MKLVVDDSTNKIVALVEDTHGLSMKTVDVPVGFNPQTDFSKYEYDPLTSSIKVKKITKVSMRQARLALHTAGLLSNVNATLAGITDEDTRVKAQIEWEYATEVDRSSSLLAAMKGALGLTDEQLDSLFVSASQL